MDIEDGELETKEERDNKNKEKEILKSNQKKLQNSIIEYPLLENIVKLTEDIDTVSKNDHNNSSEE